MNSKDLSAIKAGFEADKDSYWSMRSDLLQKYRGKWVAIHKGRVVAVGDDPVSIMDEAIREDGYAYTNKVGEEEKIIVTKRRKKFEYDTSYGPTYGAKVKIGNKINSAIIEPTSEPERLLGRDVLNQCKVTFDGPKHQTVFH